MYARSSEECLAPFKDSTSPVYTLGLRLVGSDTLMVKCPFYESWAQECSNASTEYKLYNSALVKHAKAYAMSFRPWANSTFRSALASSRPEMEKDAIVDELFAALEHDVVRNPHDHGCDIPILQLLLTKVA